MTEILFHLYVILFWSLAFILGLLGWFAAPVFLILWLGLIYARRRQARHQRPLRRLIGALGLFLLSVLLFLLVGFLGQFLYLEWVKMTY